LKKILIITSRIPFPHLKGDQLRIFFQLVSLSKNNEIHLICINEKLPRERDLTELKKYCKTVNIYILPMYKSIALGLIHSFKKIPFQVGYFYSKTIKADIHELINKIKPNAIYTHLIRVTEYVKEINNIPKTLDYMDAFSLGMKKRIEIEKSSLFKFILTIEYNLLNKYEKKMAAHFNNLVAISEQDKYFIEEEMEVKKPFTIIKNGVDFSMFYPKKLDKEFDICFMGNMNYPPNINAVTYIANEILPLLLLKNKNVKFLIAGANPSAEVENLANENITIKKNMPDISLAIAASKLMLAPMLISIGLQNKIIQAMAMKVPNIVTSAANIAINAIDGKEIIIANTPQEFAQKIDLLLNNAQLCTQIADNSFEFVRKHYNWDNISTELEKVILN
jgi:polysaccharide biosynthesis protein PslH